MSETKEYWESYYAKHRNPKESSLFAQFVQPFLKPGKKLVELGCGNGRDSIFFSNLGVEVLGLDQCPDEMTHLNKNYGTNNLKFECADFTSFKDSSSVDFAYSRFTLHAIDLESEKNTLNNIYQQLIDSGLFFIEVRSTFDPWYGKGEKVAEHAFISDHYRRFIDLDEFILRCEKIGFKVIYKIISTGLAPHKDEDPKVIRVILQK